MEIVIFFIKSVLLHSTICVHILRVNMLRSSWQRSMTQDGITPGDMLRSVMPRLLL